MTTITLTVVTVFVRIGMITLNMQDKGDFAQTFYYHYYWFYFHFH